MENSTINFEKLKVSNCKAIKDHIINNAGFTCYSKSGKEIGYSYPNISLQVLMKLVEYLSRIEYLLSSGLATSENPSQMEDLALNQMMFYKILQDNHISNEEIIDIINEFESNE
tara:strand:+ start:6534 stop:6875 length:342 start_codon:yes stop_codon:yes gene_type:complete